MRTSMHLYKGSVKRYDYIQKYKSIMKRLEANERLRNKYLYAIEGYNPDPQPGM